MLRLKRGRSSRVSPPSFIGSKGNQFGANGSIEFSGSEYWGDNPSRVDANATVREDHFKPHPLHEKFHWLSGISTKFQYYKFKYMAIRYEPFCGTSKEGSLCIWCSSDISEDRAYQNWTDVASLGTQVHGPLWAPLKLVFPSSVLNSRSKFYIGDFFAGLPVPGFKYPDRVGQGDKLFANDPLEHFFGCCGYFINAAKPDPGATQQFGHVYIDYTIVMWKPDVIPRQVGIPGPVNNALSLGRIHPEFAGCCYRSTPTVAFAEIQPGTYEDHIRLQVFGGLINASNSEHYQQMQVTGDPFFSFDSRTGVCTVTHDLDLLVNIQYGGDDITVVGAGWYFTVTGLDGVDAGTAGRLVGIHNTNAGSSANGMYHYKALVGDTISVTLVIEADTPQVYPDEFIMLFSQCVAGVGSDNQLTAV